jgi:predicted MPP superfamily phosphohydrolase
MIARQFLLYLLLILLPDIYLVARYLRKQTWWKLLLYALPTLFMLVYTIVLARVKDFLPDNPDVLYGYLFLVGLIVIPKALFSLFSLFGRWGRRLGWLAVAVDLYVLFYGSFVGFQKLEVRRVELSFPDLPAGFDGYRIVQFSDAHLGTYTEKRQHLLQRAVDSINAQKADLIVFTGDIQNQRPEEIKPHMELLSTLKARDGVFSVFGNHDYPDYIDADPYTKEMNFEKTYGYEQKMNWHVLYNSHVDIHRGDDSIVLAGMANDGEGRFPQKGNIPNTLWHVSRDAFIVMLEHDPTSWRRRILRECHAQLTLSGHTHSAQFSLFGWSPLNLLYREVDGLYTAGPCRQQLFVSKDLGGVVPFRFGATGEIVVITLKKSQG